MARLAVLLDLGLGYLSLERSTPTLSPGELQRLRLATQVRSNLFGVVYVLDEPSAGLHPADTEALLRALDRLKASGNSLFVVEHELDVDPPRRLDRRRRPGRRRARRRGPLQRPAGGPAQTSRRRRRAATCSASAAAARGRRAQPRAGCELRGRHAQQPATTSTSLPARRVHHASPASPGSGKSSLVSQALVELVARAARPRARRRGGRGRRARARAAVPHRRPDRRRAWSAIKRLVRVDQKPIGRTPRSNLATYTGLFDHVRKLFAATKPARARRYDAGPLLVQRRQGPLRDLRGRGLRDGRAAVPAERLRALPDLPRRALQRQDARDHVPRQEHRRRAGA